MRTILVVFAVAVALNYPWELAQGPLYEGMSDWRVAAWHCFVASLGDGVLVLLILAVGSVVLRRSDWFEQPGVPGYLVMLTIGALLATAVETVAVQVLNRWSYADAMPLIPGTNVGFVPVLQLIVLPPLVLLVARAILRRWPRRS